MKLNNIVLRESWKSWVASDRRRVGPYWLQLMWTFLFCCALALGFTVLGFLAWGRRDGGFGDVGRWAYWYGKNWIVCMTIGFLIHGLYELFGALLGGPRRLAKFTGVQRVAFYAGIPLLGVVLGWPLGIWLAGGPVLDFFIGPDARRVVGGSLLISLVITVVLYLWFSARSREIHFEREATLAQLRLLQAQMEPHFMFNTLANVLALMDSDALQARRMLEAFTEYLRASLTQMRRQEGTLAHEVELTERYLVLMGARMEDRLSYALQVPANLRGHTLPPLLLQPLVENAIHHGLEPQVQGGRVQITARREADELVLEVSDDGRGLGAPKRSGGNGVALANLRERLATAYGGMASLEVLPQAQGTLARIRLPFEPAV
jgi:signal transduction histidine kinase